MNFPTVHGTNLLRQKLILPNDFQGNLNLVIIAFRQWQQMVVNTWLPAAKGLEQRYPGLQTYELPVIQPLNAIAKAFINEGMRAGIPNTTTRQQTVTLYIDKQQFCRQLDIQSEDDITILLLDSQGRILWRERGSYLPEKEISLALAIGEAQRELVYA